MKFEVGDRIRLEQDREDNEGFADSSTGFSVTKKRQTCTIISRPSDTDTLTQCSPPGDIDRVICWLLHDDKITWWWPEQVDGAFEKWSSNKLLLIKKELLGEG